MTDYQHFYIVGTVLLLSSFFVLIHLCFCSSRPASLQMCQFPSVHFSKEMSRNKWTPILGLGDRAVLELWLWERPGRATGTTLCPKGHLRDLETDLLVTWRGSVAFSGERRGSVSSLQSTGPSPWQHSLLQRSEYQG